jgi:peptidoglycan/xylan/chitin deacetylase (PgdA/CDA1 family)
VPATFFFVGVQAQKYPHWVKMVHQAGHEIGSHTYDHFRLPKMPRQEKIYQIDEYQRLVEGLTGETPRFLRPPGGQVDAETQQLLADRHMLLALWDVALNDTREDKTSEMIYKTARSEIRSGSVVLLHDGIQATVDMLPELITQLKNQGFEFVTMSELAAGM